MEPVLLFAVMALVVVALGVYNARRQAARAREIFTPLAGEVGGRVTAPKLGTPSLRFAVEIRDGRVTIHYGQPSDAPAARQLVELGRAVRESLERQDRAGDRPVGDLA